MKKILNGTVAKALALVLCLAVTCTFSTAVYAESEITVTIDGRLISFDVQPTVVGGGYTMVPMRAIFEELGYTVEYISNTQMITARNYATDNMMVLKLGDYTMVCCPLSLYNSIGDAVFTSRQYERTLDVAPFAYAGYTYVPVRAIAEATNASVSWDPNINRVVIVSQGSQAEQYYPGTDIPTYHYLTGVQPSSVVTGPSGNVIYRYPGDYDMALHYISGLDGFISDDSIDSFIVAFSPKNKMFFIAVDDNELVVSPMTLTTYWEWNGSKFEVPDFSYVTGIDCLHYEFDDDGDMAYTYQYTNESMTAYLTELNNEGFVLIGDYGNDFLCENGNSRVLIEINPILGRVVITPFGTEGNVSSGVAVYSDVAVPDYGEYVGETAIDINRLDNGTWMYIYRYDAGEYSMYTDYLKSIGYTLTSTFVDDPDYIYNIYENGTYRIISMRSDLFIIINPQVISGSGSSSSINMYPGVSVPDYGAITGKSLIDSGKDSDGDTMYMYEYNWSDLNKYESVLTSLGFTSVKSGVDYVNYNRGKESVLIEIDSNNGAIVLTPYDNGSGANADTL